MHTSDQLAFLFGRSSRLPVTMTKDRPQLSITLPRNFTFHYTDGEGPKTPEQEDTAPKAQSPRAYKIRRRGKPSIVSSNIYGQSDGHDPQDVPIPTIETPASPDPMRPTLQQRVTEPASGFLAPVMPGRFSTAPRTPSAQLPVFVSDWNDSAHKSFGESISRPMSTCSLMSDSSDDSDCSSATSHQSLGGSCTSPESDAPDPFSFPSPQNGKARNKSTSVEDTPLARKTQTSKPRLVFWTSDMDKHLWTTYMIYLQDPTVTPFKTLPGSPPPLGVCHRVAREAKRTWRGTRLGSTRLSHELGYFNINSGSSKIARSNSPDTIKAGRSGSNTPTRGLPAKQPSWPKTGASTRRRLRELCKRKATIAPHYQRLLQSRSPSPFTSSPRSASKSVHMSSPPREGAHLSPFATRDIQLSLTTSTAASMQPDGPLAQLSRDDVPTNQLNHETLGNTRVPWASPAPIPSDIEVEAGIQDTATELPHLGTPFGYHTWGPSRSRPLFRPTTPRMQPNDVAEPSSSMQFLHGTFPYPNVQKRRAQHQLEVELSPGGTGLRKNLVEDIFTGPSQSTLRRVRTRGFTVGDATIHDRLAALFTPSEPSAPFEETDAMNTERGNGVQSHADSIRRLGSPFAGISGRPSRARGRHLASASLSSYDPNSFASIEQRLSQINHTAL